MTAIIFVSGLAARTRLRLAGLTLLERALIVAARAGVRRCLIAGAPAELRHEARFPRLTPVADLEDAKAVLRSEGATAETRVLCLGADVVSTPQSVAAFLVHAPARGTVALHSVPVALVASGDLDAVWPSFAEPESGGLELLTSTPGVSHTNVPEGLFCWLRSPSQAPEIERRLLLSLENPRDGRVDTMLNRKLSRPLTRLLLPLPLTPNHVTLMSFLTGILAAFAFAQGTYGGGLLGALLFQLSAVLDCCDGEIARVKFKETKLGDGLDITLDAIANVAIFFGMARGAWIAGALPDAPLIAWGIGIGILGTFPLVTYIERALPAPAATPEHRLAQRLVSTLTTRDFSVVVLLAALTGTLPWFVRGAAIGANAFWILLLVLLLRGRNPSPVGFHPPPTGPPDP